MTTVHITKKSGNSKVGPIPVPTSSADTCPKSCAMYDQCYAKTGPQSWHWNKVTAGKRGGNWSELTDFVRSLKPHQVWRHNVSGDLPHVVVDDVEYIRLDLLKELVDANKSSDAKGYTYSHHKLHSHNLEALKYANQNGFTINASCESLAQADDAMDRGLPAVCVVNSDQSKCPKTTPQGRKVTICPAQLHDKVTCSNCQLCSHTNRSNVVAFLAHGARSKQADQWLNA